MYTGIIHRNDYNYVHLGYLLTDWLFNLYGRGRWIFNTPKCFISLKKALRCPKRGRFGVSVWTLKKKIPTPFHRNQMATPLEMCSSFIVHFGFTLVFMSVPKGGNCTNILACIIHRILSFLWELFLHTVNQHATHDFL